MRTLQAERQHLQDAVVRGFGLLLGLKDPHSSVHSVRTARWAVSVARRLGLDEEQQREVEIAALLHDIGKIGIPDPILNKRGPLTLEESMVINKHPEYGWGALRKFPGFERISLIVLHHHERIDGKGYPARLSGRAIPLGSRIISVIDAFDAMHSSRCYRRALPLDEALRRIEAASATQFDSGIVKHFIGMITRELPGASHSHNADLFLT